MSSNRQSAITRLIADVGSSRLLRILETVVVAYGNIATELLSCSKLVRIAIAYITARTTLTSVVIEFQ